MATGRTNKQGGASVSLTGDAVIAEVLNGKTFYNTDPNTKLMGTMPNKVGSATVITPSTSDQTIPQGYYGGVAGDGKVSGDADLISANIKSGANIFGVAGSSNVVDTSSGDAVAGEILATKKAWVDGAEITGSMANNGAYNITPSASNQSIPAGYHNGSGVVVGDSDLVAGNIKNGVNIFGVTGTFDNSGTPIFTVTNIGYLNQGIANVNYSGAGVACLRNSNRQFEITVFFKNSVITDSSGYVTSMDGVSLGNYHYLNAYSINNAGNSYQLKEWSTDFIKNKSNVSGPGMVYLALGGNVGNGVICLPYNSNFSTDSNGLITTIDGVGGNSHCLVGYSN